MCTVTKIHSNSVFVDIDEYDNKRAMLHISEVSPGRIRNLRDFVKEGKVIVCVVLRVDMERGLIDVSLRRVNDNQKREKLNEVKQEQMAEKMVEFLAKELKIDFGKLYAEITPAIFKEYGSLYHCFEDVALKDASLAKLGIRSEIEVPMTAMIKQRIKPIKLNLGGKLTLNTYQGDGIDAIKRILGEAVDMQKGAITIKYLGAGTYRLNIVTEDYKNGEKLLEKITSFVEKEIKKSKGVYLFERMDVE